MEQRIVARESTLPYHAIPTAALRGRHPFAMLKNSITMVRGIVAGIRLLRELRPSAILGTGGYVCVPLIIAARVVGIPTLVYLPDVVPGLAVRFLARIATQVACSVEDTLAHLPNAVVTGYPTRPDLTRLDRASCRAAFGLQDDLPVVIIYGGSRGARSINRAVEALLPALVARAQVIHVCGREGDEQWLRETAAMLDDDARARYHLFPYLEAHGDQTERTERTERMERTMIAALCAADVAVCRSGASVLGELPMLGLPAVLVPYPYVHQDENAAYLARHGAATMVTDGAMVGDGDPTAGPLFRAIAHLIEDSHERLEMAQRSRMLARPDAAHRLAQALRGLTAK